MDVRKKQVAILYYCRLLTVQYCPYCPAILIIFAIYREPGIRTENKKNLINKLANHDNYIVGGIKYMLKPLKKAMRNKKKKFKHRYT